MQYLFSLFILEDSLDQLLTAAAGSSGEGVPTATSAGGASRKSGIKGRLGGYADVLKSVMQQVGFLRPKIFQAF